MTSPALRAGGDMLSPINFKSQRLVTNFSIVSALNYKVIGANAQSETSRFLRLMLDGIQRFKEKKGMNFRWCGR